MPMKARYTFIDGEVVAEKRNGVRKSYVPDPLGSTVALLDNTQTATDTFTYWPYGQQESRMGTTSTRFGFVGARGYYTDARDRVYVRNRELSTLRGSWITADPIGQARHDANLYRYVSGSPVSKGDPSGLTMTCLNCSLFTCLQIIQHQWDLCNNRINTIGILPDPTGGLSATPEMLAE